MMVSTLLSVYRPFGYSLLWSHYFSIVFSFFNGLSVFFLLICTSLCQFSSVAQSCPTLCDPMECSQASPSFTISWSLLNHIPIELVMSSSYLVLCLPLLLLPSVFPRIRVFSNESALCIWWPQCWSFRFRISYSIHLTVEEIGSQRSWVTQGHLVSKRWS